MRRRRACRSSPPSRATKRCRTTPVTVAPLTHDSPPTHVFEASDRNQESHSTNVEQLNLDPQREQCNEKDDDEDKKLKTRKNLKQRRTI